MAIIVPSLPISGALLVNSSQTGSTSIFTSGSKVNAAPPGVAINFWRDQDGNVISQAITDIVNNGTVLLFASASKFDTLSGSFGTLSGVLSSSYYLSSSGATLSGNLAAMSASLSTSLSGTSGSVAVWGLPITGVVDADKIYRFTSASWKNDAVYGNQIGALQFTASYLSQSMYGDQVGDFGISGTVLALSSAFYGSSVGSNVIVSGALQKVAYAFFGSADLAVVSGGLGGVTGSHPIPTFNNLREAFYSLTSSFNSSGTKWDAVSSSYATLSSNLDASATIWNAAAAGGIGDAFLTSSHWAPAGGTSFITGSVSISGTGSGTLYLYSPNGNRWAITIDNAGVLSSTLA